MAWIPWMVWGGREREAPSYPSLHRLHVLRQCLGRRWSNLLSQVGLSPQNEPMVSRMPDPWKAHPSPLHGSREQSKERSMETSALCSA